MDEYKVQVNQKSTLVLNG